MNHSRSSFLPVLGCALLALLIGASPLHAADAPSDAQALQQLKQSGSDLAKLHRVEYQLRFHGQDDSAVAAARLEDLAFAVKRERDDATDSWVVLASKRMYPVQSDLEQLSTKVKTVASESQGAYEGWRASQLD